MLRSKASEHGVAVGRGVERHDAELDGINASAPSLDASNNAAVRRRDDARGFIVAEVSCSLC